MSAFDTSSGLRSARASRSSAQHWGVKLSALVLLLLCVAVGLAGLILPLIPGLLFLALALIIAARLCPPLGRRLRRHAVFAPYMHRSDHFAGLSLQGKLKFAFWFAAKILWDSCVLLVAYCVRFVAWLRKDGGAF